MTAIITGKTITKTYGNTDEKTVALADVTLAVLKGEFVAIMGPSGSGKSTLLYALSGMDTISSGSVALWNQPLSELDDNQLADVRRKKIGFIFQQPMMVKNLDILDNILLPAVTERKKIGEMTEKAMKLMKQTGVNTLATRDITEVSGGQLQRAGICRALINSPEIIFADEPTGALNSKASEEVMDLLRDIHLQGTAILIVTHDAKVAARAERVVFMKDGRLVTTLSLGKDSGADQKRRLEAVSDMMTEVER